MQTNTDQGDYERLREELAASFEGLSDADTRLRVATALDANAMVEAGAGTGKTSLTVSRIAYGICTGRYILSRLVVITFTEKAAAELRDRVRQKLEDLAARYEGPVRAHARRALQQLDVAHISTIHSFCSRVLTEFSMAAGVDPGFSVADALESRLVMEEAWEDWVEQQVASAETPLAELLKRDVTLEQLRSAAFRLADERELLLREEGPAPRQNTPAAERTDTAGVREVVLAQVRAMQPLAEKTAGLKNRRTGAALIRFAEYLARIASDVEEMSDEDLLNWLVYSAYRTEANMPKKMGALPKGLTESDCDRLMTALGELDGLRDRVTAAWTAAALPELSRFIRFYEDRMRRLGLVDFKGLLVRARDLLKQDLEVRRRLKERFQAIYVDEFQDTDPLQTEMVFFLAEEPAGEAAEWHEVVPAPGGLFIVGDPKQSIYRFRRADLRIYNAAKDLFGENERFAITTNFRSNQRLLEAFDTIFERVDALPSYESLARSPATPPGERNVVFICGETPQESPSAEESRAAQATCLARTIRSMIQTGRVLHDREDACRRPCHAGDFAVLMRKMTNVSLIEQALEAEGLPYRVFGGKSFYEQQEIQYAVTLLRAVDNPLDSVSVAGLLRSPFFGISDDELLMHRAAGGGWNCLHTESEPPGPVRDALETLRGWHGRRLESSPARFLESVLAESHLYEFYLAGPSGEQRVANLAKLLDQARTLERSGNLTFHKIAMRLRALAQEGRHEAEEESTTAEPTENVVRIMTIHKAKGLEFPIVAVPFLSDALWSGGDQAELIIDRMSSRVEMKLTSTFRTDGWDGAAEQEAREEEEELARLLYVVLTRARSWLILPWDWPYAHSGSRGSFQTLLSQALEKAGVRLGVDVNCGWAHCVRAEALDVAETSAQVQGEKEDEDGPAIEKALTLRSDLRARLDDLRGALSRQPFIYPSELRQRAPEAVSVKGGREIGELFHLAMRIVPLNADEAAVAESCRMAADRLGASDERCEEVTGLVKQTLAHPLLDRVRAAERVVREQPFCIALSAFGIPEDGRVLDGTVDLLFMEEGRPVVVDFKTAYVEPEDCEGWAEQYLPQLAVYAYAVEHLLARPEVLLFWVRPAQVVPLTQRVFTGTPAERLREFLAEDASV